MKHSLILITVLLFHAGKANINAAQGSLVEVSGDRWAFLYHDYNLFATYGRRLYL